MTYYIILFVIVLLLSLVVRKDKQKGDMIMVFISILLFLFFGFRIGFTMDYDNYKVEFGFANERHESEPLFIAMTTLLSYRAGLIIQAALFSVLLFISFKYYINKRYWWLCFCILFWNMDFMLGFFSGYRSSYVTMALFLALFIKDKMGNNIPSLIISAIIIYISSLIHHSGLYLLPILLIPIKPISSRTMKGIKIATVVAVFVFLFSADLILKYATMVAETYSEDMMMYYLNNQSVDNYYFSIANIIALAAKLYMLFYTYSWMENRKGREIKGTLFITMTALFFFLMLVPAVGLISRLFFYMLFPTLIGVSIMMSNEKDNNKRILFLTSLTIYLFLKLRIFVMADIYIKQMDKYQNILFS